MSFLQRMLNVFKGVMFSLTFLMLVSCHLLNKENETSQVNKPSKTPRKSVKGIGEVVSINMDEEFLLVDVFKPKLASKGDFFYIERGSRKAVLKPTGEKIGSYFAADIISGKAQLSDPVLVKLPKPPEPNPILNKPENTVNQNADVTQQPESLDQSAEIKADLPLPSPTASPQQNSEAIIKGSDSNQNKENAPQIQPTSSNQGNVNPPSQTASVTPQSRLD